MSERPAELRIQSEDHADEAVTIGRPPEGTDGFHEVPVSLEANGLSCTRQAIMCGDDGIRAFFAEMAADWRGWSGRRTWTTLESDLVIRAVHTGRRIALTFTLQRDNYPDAWQVSLAMSLAPGESLSRLASDIDELFEGV